METKKQLIGIEITDYKLWGRLQVKLDGSLMPQQRGNLKQIRDFAVSSIESGLDGLLLTLWDDDSPHFELYKRGIMGFANDTWSGDKISKDEF